MTAPASHRIREIRRSLLSHYDEHRRDLPWRGEEDPYRVWVSEIMLQQTRVETVIPYYMRWMERFPRLEDLASSEQDEVLEVWSGLGYYSRARNLHRAARRVRELHGGSLPASKEALNELPGVGDYTAGAVASIAFGLPEPAVDGNVRRVLSRLDDLPEPGGAELRRRAGLLVDPERPGCFNQALMDLGATICTPKSPSCAACPLESHCLARERGTVDERPPPRKRPRVRERRVAVAVPVDGDGRTILVRRPEDGLLGGMWEFPAAGLEVGPTDDGEGKSGGRGRTDGRAQDERAEEAVDGRSDGAAESAGRAARKRGIGLSGHPPVSLGVVNHAFTHLRLTYLPYLFAGADLAEAGVEAADVGHGVRIVPLRELQGQALPAAQQEIGARAGEVWAGIR